MQDPDKFIEQADQEQSELRQKLEAATERVKAVEASHAAVLTWMSPHLSACPCTRSQSHPPTSYMHADM